MPDSVTGRVEGPVPVFVSAGDPSGDIAGSHLLKCLKEKCGDFEFFGLGGRRMHSEGQRQMVDGERLAVLGFWEVARHYLFFRNLMSRVVGEIKQIQPKTIILIDYPGFNLLLAEKIRSLGIPIVYYVSPQIWAWGGKRIAAIKRNIDLMLLILPFEAEIYQRAWIKSKFVGHYLLDDIESRYIKAPYNADSDLIALLPGSRPQEVERMLPTLIKTAEILARDRVCRFAIAALESNIDYEKYMRKVSCPIELVFGKTREVIAQSRLVITSSGTATLEAGIIGRPMVVIYRTGWITYNIARRLIKLDKIALINITAGKKIVPELIQGDATAARIAAEAARIWNDKHLAYQTVNELNSTTDLLGRPGAGTRAADAIMEYINC